VECSEELHADFGEPLRQGYWRLRVEAAGPPGSEAVRGLSPFSWRLPALGAGRGDAPGVAESRGLGYGVVLGGGSGGEGGSPPRGPTARLEIGEGIARAAGPGFSLEAPLSTGAAALYRGRVTAAVSSGGEAVAVMGEDGVALVSGVEEASVRADRAPSRACWLQPFALACDFLGEGEAIASQYVELHAGGMKLVLASPSPLSVYYPGLGRPLRLVVRGDARLLAMWRSARDLTPLADWSSACLGWATVGEVPKVRVSPPALVAYEVYARWSGSGRWEVRLGLSNPSSADTSFSVFVDRPYFAEAASVGGEPVEGAASYLEGFLGAYSAVLVELSVRKKETLLAGR